MKRRLTSKADAIVAAVLLAAACGVLFYFIAFPAWTEFHGDCTDSLLWSKMMIETGSILAEDFAYAAILPFGSPLWMVPVLLIFGYGKAAHVVSMCMFVVLFIGAVYLLLRTLKWRRWGCALGAATVAFLLSATEKLREIMWGHVIYYSLSALLVLWLLNLVVRLWSALPEWKATDTRGRVRLILQCVGLFLLSLGCATDGFQVIIISVLPVLCGMIGTVVTDRRDCLRAKPTLFRMAMGGGMAVGVGLGALVLFWLTKGGEIAADYENAHTMLAPLEEGGENMGRILPNWLSLFGVVIDETKPLTDVQTLLSLVHMAVALTMLVCPFVLFARSLKSDNAPLRLLTWTHLGMTAVNLFAYICGKVSGANWRLVPWAATCVLCTVVLIGELLREHLVPRRMGGLLGLAVGAVAAINAVTMLTWPCLPNPHEVMAKELIDRGYTRGYASFWQALDTDFFGGDELDVVCIEASTAGIVRRDYQTRECWFDDVEGQETYFVILTGDEYTWVSASHHWKEINRTYEMLDVFDLGDNGEYTVFVFNGNIVKNFD